MPSSRLPKGCVRLGRWGDVGFPTLSNIAQLYPQIRGASASARATAQIHAYRPCRATRPMRPTLICAHCARPGSLGHAKLFLEPFYGCGAWLFTAVFGHRRPSSKSSPGADGLKSSLCEPHTNPPSAFPSEGHSRGHNILLHEHRGINPSLRHGCYARRQLRQGSPWPAIMG